MRFKWIIGVIAVVVATGVGLFQVQVAGAIQEATPGLDSYGSDTEYTEQGTTGYDVQPINFPHSVHAGTYQMDCQYCHYSAGRSNSAGMPPVSSCMGCHTMVAGEGEYNQSQINLLREYWNEGETIPWVRIHKVADHVHFPHLRHVNAGLECQECHGPVEEYQNALVQPHPNWGKGKMGWCISCHVEQDVQRDCTVCHY